MVSEGRRKCSGRTVKMSLGTDENAIESRRKCVGRAIKKIIWGQMKIVLGTGENIVGGQAKMPLGWQSKLVLECWQRLCWSEHLLSADQ